MSLPNPVDLPKQKITTLLAIMQALRTPKSGCPWDLTQNFDTIAPYTLEEAYEVVDAIARKNMDDLCEELGDLLLQVVYHAQMAQESGEFDFADVVTAITSKMIRRHPHVFGDDDARATAPAKGFWESSKALEREKSDVEANRVLAGIAQALPALQRAQKLQARAARVGFDWPHSDHVLDKIIEEADELRSAAPKDQQEEFGDLLFAVVNLGRHMGIDSETALRATNEKFTRRFEFIEDQLATNGKTPAQSDLSEMDDLWNAAKTQEKS